MIEGETLLLMIRAVQAGGAVQQHQRIEPIIGTPVPALPSVPDCPRCGTQVVERRNRRNGNVFWGCSTCPDCKGTW